MTLESSSNPASENPGTTYEDEVPFSTSKPHKEIIAEDEERVKPEDKMSESARKSREKEEMLASVAEKKKKGPLQLLDLPVDLLKDITKEVRFLFEGYTCSYWLTLIQVTHTNDLTSLALTHSALHNLVIPHIYSRFDIVWPDAHITAEPRNGVDALTYGLATLVMREDLFDTALGCHNESCHGYHSYACNHCGKVNYLNPSHMQSSKPSRRLRRGNFFSQFTRKFSLGNGPPEWVQEYLITKEAGKMLGTLIALTIARMPNLETFIWDMPTGILRDVWIALSSLGDCKYDRGPKLDTLWIRLHDNREVLPTAGTSQPNAALQPTQTSAGAVSNPIVANTNPVVGQMPAPTRVEWSYRHIERPNFSMISRLRRLCVLNIDEIAYLAELSTLIDRSLDRLRELRIGIASHVRVSGWASTQSGSVSDTLSNEDTTTRNLKAGGEFAVLVNKFYDCYVDRNPPNTTTGASESVIKVVNGGSANEIVGPTEATPTTNPSLNDDPNVEIEAPSLLHSSPSGHITEPPQAYAQPTEFSVTSDKLDQEGGLTESLPMSGAHQLPIRMLCPSDGGDQQSQPSPSGLQTPPRSNASLQAVTPLIPTQSKPKQLRLEILELERVLLDVPVLQKTIDWPMMTSLTLFQCDGHEGLWKAMRRRYTPRSSFIHSRTSSGSAAKCMPPHTPAWNAETYPSQDYRLNLKRIHTDQVSPSLISFLKETLAPNSLEWMFFQEEGGPVRKNVTRYISPVTIEAIYRGPMRRHRASLKKILIDSAVGPSNTRARDQKWRKWMFNKELLTFITSGKMSSLKEIAMAVDYKDWVQWLPTPVEVVSVC